MVSMSALALVVVSVSASALASLSSVYNNPYHIVDAIEFICGIYIGILPP